MARRSNARERTFPTNPMKAAPRSGNIFPGHSEQETPCCVANNCDRNNQREHATPRTDQLPFIGALHFSFAAFALALRSQAPRATALRCWKVCPTTPRQRRQVGSDATKYSAPVATARNLARPPPNR